MGRISFGINETPCRQREREHPAPFRGLIREDNHQAGDDDVDEHDDDICGDNYNDDDYYLRPVEQLLLED